MATVRPDGSPHLVPIVHATLPGDVIVFAVDAKPKRSVRLQRLANIRHEPRVALLADHYDDDWGRLWWVRADGVAAVVEDTAEREEALGHLIARYPAYRDVPPAGPVVRIGVLRWTGWRAT